MLGLSWKSAATLLRAGTLALVVGAGCGFGDDLQGGTTAGEGPSTSGAGGGTEGSGTGGLGTTTGGESGGDGTDGFGPGDAPTPCDGITCNYAGACVLDDEGQPMCQCDPDFVAVGLTCQKCAPTDGVANIELPTALVELTFTLNGVAPPQSAAERGDILLRDRATGQEVRVGSTHEGSGQVRVLHGTYDVIYARVNGGNLVPVNSHAIVGRLEVSGDMAGNVNVPMATVGGEILLDGAPAPYLAAERGDFVLRGTVDPQDEALLGRTGDENYWANVVPGVYEVHYKRQQGTGSKMPLNDDVVLSWIEVTPGGNPEVPQPLDLEVTPMRIEGTLLLNGAAPPASPAERGTILLVDVLTRDELVIARTEEGGGTYSSPLIQPGTYELVYRREQSVSGTVPANRYAVLDVIDVNADNRNVDIILKTEPAAGTIQLAGGPAPTDPQTAGEVVLRDATGRDEVVLARTDQGAFNVSSVLSGTYDLYYRFASGPQVMPANTGARLLQGVTPSDLGIVEIPVQTLSGAITVNGGAPPASAFDYGMLSLRDPVTGDTAFLGTTQSGSFSRLVVPGTYDVHYLVGVAGGVMPINVDSRAAIGVAVQDGAPANYDVVLTSTQLMASASVNGEPAPTFALERGRIYLRDPDTGARILLGTTDGPMSAQIMPGRYVVEYELINGGTLVPANPRSAVACIDVP